MLLRDAYIGLHLEPESEKMVRSCLDSEVVSDGMTRSKSPHLTLDYFGEMHEDILENLIFGTRVNLLLANNPRNSFRIRLRSPEHLLSDVTGEDIIYLPAEIPERLLGSFQYQGYSVRTPHVTLLKGKNLTAGQIERTIKALEKIIPPTGLFIDTKEVFFHGKTETGEDIVRGYTAV